MDKILIAGGSGMIGKALAEHLRKMGYEINFLVRTKELANGKDRFFWDYKAGEVDLNCMEGVGYIINLCGANVGTHMWTKRYKQEIIDSRVLSARALAVLTNMQKMKIKKYISAGGISYYGDSGTKEMKEEEPKGNGFLADVTGMWEHEVHQIEAMGIPTVIFRLGVVLSNKGGFVPTLALPAKLFASTTFGSGKQIMSWVHIDDVVSAFEKALIQPDFIGTFNLVAPSAASMNEVTRQIASQLRRPVILPNVPASICKFVLGERSEILLHSVNASPDKLLSTGFAFRYPTLQSALNQVFSK